MHGDTPRSLASPGYARNVPLAVFLVSGSILALELSLTRLLSIAYWYHFAYLIVSLALLGYGASGSFLHLARRAIERRPARALTAFALLLAVTCVGAWPAAGVVPLNVLALSWDPAELIHLALWGAILLLPFFFGAAFTGTALMTSAHAPERIYGASLLGSGAGVIGALALMHGSPPQEILGWCGAAALAAAALSAPLTRPDRNQTDFCSSLPDSIPFPGSDRAAQFRDANPDPGIKPENDRSIFTRFSHNFTDRVLRGRLRLVLLVCTIPVGVFLIQMAGSLTVPLNQYKDLAGLLRLPDARIVRQEYSPMGRIDVVESALIRYAPGLALNYTGPPVPPQTALTIDCGSTMAVTDFTGDPRSLEFLDHTTAALPYHLTEPAAVLVLGSGAGLDVLAAVYHGARLITAVEINPLIVRLAREAVPRGRPSVYDRGDVRLVISEARRFVQGTDELFNIITIPLLDTFSAVASGVHSGRESYLYTIEAFEAYLDRLEPEGVLCITRWVRTPPRDALKLVATASDALARRGTSDPADHIILIRNWRTVSLLVSARPWRDTQIAAVKQFCDARGIDTAYYPGMEPSEANLFHVLPEPSFYEGALAILGPGRDGFLRAERFDLRPATDDRPYFFRFIRTRDLPWLFELDPTQRAALMEWGSVIIVPALILVTAGVLLLVVIPVAVPGREIGGLFGPASACFAMLGFGFMFLEIAMMQRLGLLLAHPVYSVAVVLGTFLMGSGMGSLAAERSSLSVGIRCAWALAGVVVFSIVLAAVIRTGLAPVWRWGLAARCAACAALSFPLAFVMGIPFPSALRVLKEKRPEHVPLAWAVNGAASVIGAVLAALVAMEHGFTAVVGVGVVCYSAAFLAWRRRDSW